jgi:hypothetical protein
LTANLADVRVSSSKGERRIDMAEKTTPDHIKERIREILMEDGWSVREESTPKAIWAYIAENRARIKIVVGQKIDREDQIVIQGSVSPDDIIANKMAQLPEDERSNFLWDLRFELLRTDLEFSGIEMPLKRVEVSTRIVLDALTKDTFLLRTSQVRKGMLVIIWMIAKKFAQQPPQRQLGFQR